MTPNYYHATMLWYLIGSVMRDYMLLDGMSLVYPFASKIESLPMVTQRKAIEDWVGYFSRPWLYTPEVNPIRLDPWDCLPILCMDLKYPGTLETPTSLRNKYWRHTYFKGYKSGRKEKTPGLITTRSLIIACWQSYGLPYLSQPGFEADDFAGAWVQTMGTDERVGLVSIDGDWAQLVTEQVMWMDVFPPSRRSRVSQKKSVLGPLDVLERFNDQKEYQKYPITCPGDIVNHKHRFGDPSDKIPKDHYVPIGIIDLMNPLHTPEMDAVLSIRGGAVPDILPPVSRSAHFMFGVPDWKGGSDQW